MVVISSSSSVSRDAHGHRGLGMRGYRERKRNDGEKSEGRERRGSKKNKWNGHRSKTIDRFAHSFKLSLFQSNNDTQLLDTNAIGVRREKMYQLDGHIGCAVAGITGEGSGDKEKEEARK